MIRAEQLAKWLSTHPPKGFGAREKIVPGKFQTQLAGRTGVIFLKTIGREATKLLITEVVTI